MSRILLPRLSGLVLMDPPANTSAPRCPAGSMTRNAGRSAGGLSNHLWSWRHNERAQTCPAEARNTPSYYYYVRNFSTKLKDLARRKGGLSQVAIVTISSGCGSPEAAGDVAGSQPFHRAGQ